MVEPTEPTPPSGSQQGPNLIDIINVVAEKADPIVKVLTATMDRYQKGQELRPFDGWRDNYGMPKNMYEMDEKELQVLISQQEDTVAKLTYERPGSSACRFEAGILEDAKHLLAEKQKKKESSRVETEESS